MVPCFLLRLFDSLWNIKDHQSLLIFAPILNSIFVASPPIVKFTPAPSEWTFLLVYTFQVFPDSLVPKQHFP